jgi:hypothetical protein
MTIYCNVAQVMRGVQKINSQTVTSSMLGVFRCRIFPAIFAGIFLGLTKGRGWFLNFVEAPMIL